MADIKTAYGASIQFTMTSLASLPSDGLFVTGATSTAVDNTSTKYIDALVGGKISVGSGVTTNRQIEVWVYGNVDDTPTYPDTINGVDGVRTLSSAGTKAATLKLLSIIPTTGTNNAGYYFGPNSVASLFGGHLPKYWGLAVFQNTNAALNSSGASHNISYTPLYETVS